MGIERNESSSPLRNDLFQLTKVGKGERVLYDKNGQIQKSSGSLGSRLLFYLKSKFGDHQKGWKVLSRKIEDEFGKLIKEYEQVLGRVGRGEKLTDQDKQTLSQIHSTSHEIGVITEMVNKNKKVQAALGIKTSKKSSEAKVLDPNRLEGMKHVNEEIHKVENYAKAFEEWESIKDSNDNQKFVDFFKRTRLLDFGPFTSQFDIKGKEAEFRKKIEDKITNCETELANLQAAVDSSRKNSEKFFNDASQEKDQAEKLQQKYFPDEALQFDKMNVLDLRSQIDEAPNRLKSLQDKAELLESELRALEADSGLNFDLGKTVEDRIQDRSLTDSELGLEHLRRNKPREAVAQEVLSLSEKVREKSGEIQRLEGFVQRGSKNPSELPTGWTLEELETRLSDARDEKSLLQQHEIRNRLEKSTSAKEILSLQKSLAELEGNASLSAKLDAAILHEENQGKQSQELDELVKALQIPKSAENVSENDFNKALMRLGQEKGTTDKQRKGLLNAVAKGKNLIEGRDFYREACRKANENKSNVLNQVIEAKARLQEIEASIIAERAREKCAIHCQQYIESTDKQKQENQTITEKESTLEELEAKQSELRSILTQLPSPPPVAVGKQGPAQSADLATPVEKLKEVLSPPLEAESESLQDQERALTAQLEKLTGYTDLKEQFDVKNAQGWPEGGKVEMQTRLIELQISTATSPQDVLQHKANLAELQQDSDLSDKCLRAKDYNPVDTLKELKSCFKDLGIKKKRAESITKDDFSKLVKKLQDPDEDDIEDVNRLLEARDLFRAAEAQVETNRSQQSPEMQRLLRRRDEIRAKMA